jgi:sugar/nucleoside kinase (ribokinase family)
MQGYVRVLNCNELKNEPWPEMEITLAYLDILKSDAVEAEFLTGETDIFKAAKFYASMGPKEIVLTHKDGLLVHVDGKFHEFGFYPANLSGRSGRGDTCIGSYVAMRLTKDPREAGTWAAALTSLKMEKLGPFDRPVCDVEKLINARYNH